MTKFYIPRRRFVAGSAAGGFVGLIKPVRAGIVPCGGSVLVGTQPESAEGTAVTTVGPKIWDGAGNSYAISSGGQILTNGQLDHDPGSGVIEMYYHNNQVYQENSSSSWYTRSSPTQNWVSTTSPIPSGGSGGGGNNSSVTPLFWDDFSEGAIDWVNKWQGTPIGYGGTSTTSVGGRGGGTSYAPDQSVVQADCVSTKIIHYTDGNYYLTNTAFVAPADRPAAMQPYTYATAEIITRFAQPYGYIIGRCKMPVGHGIMGAFWMYHTEDNYIAQGLSGQLDSSGNQKHDVSELDMSENPGGTPRPLSMTVHTWDTNYGNNVYYDFSSSFDASVWHTYAVQWDPPPGNITFYEDGVQKFQKYTPFDLKYRMNIWVSQYVGVNGTWFGATDGTTVFPTRSVYDWIGWFNNKSEADTYFAANPQYSLATGGSDGPPLIG